MPAKSVLKSLEKTLAFLGCLWHTSKVLIRKTDAEPQIAVQCGLLYGGFESAADRI